MSDSLNNKELVAVGHQFAKAMSSETPIMDIAKILSRLAERLDCTTAVLHATQAQRNQLATENAALKAVCEDRRTFIMNGVQLGYIQVPTVETDPALETIRVAVSPQDPTPATDAFMAEVRASAVEEFVRMADYSESVADGEVIVTSNSVFSAGHVYADQIRKGVQS